MKKSAQSLAMILLVTMVLSTMVSCSTQEEDYRVKNPTAMPTFATIDPNWTPMPQPTDAGGAELPGNPYDYINPERLFDMGEWMDIAGMQFRLNRVDFTKKADGIDPEKMNVFHVNRSNIGQMVDEAGNLYGNRSYVIINVDIKNNTKEATDFPVGNLGLVTQVCDEKNSTTEIKYIMPEMYHDTHSNYYLLQPGETVTFTLYSIIKDSQIDNDSLYFYIDSNLVDSVPFTEGSNYQYDAYVPMNKAKSEVNVYEDYKDQRDYINPGRIYNVGETAEIKGVSFRVNDVTLGRQLEGITKDKIRYDDYEAEIVGSDGSFQEDNDWGRVYVKANITIRNLTEQEVELCTGAIYLSYPYAAGIAFSGAKGVTPSMAKDLSYDDFYRLRPGEEVTFDIYYVQHARVLTDDTLMIHFPLTMMLQEEVNPALSYEYDIFVPIKKDKSEVNIYGEG